MSDVSKDLDKNACEEYLENPWDPKYKLGLYFTAIHEISGPIYINYKVQINREVQNYRTLHSLHDGLSVLKLLSTLTSSEIKFNDYKVHIPKSKFKCILFSLFCTPPRRQHLKGQNNNKLGYNCIQKSFIIDLEPTPRLPRILKLISEVCSRHFLENDISRWMIPVRISNEDGLQASYVSMNVSSKDSLDAVNKQYRNKLKNGEYWGRYYTAKLGLLFGKAVIRYTTRKELEKKSISWLGSLSHLGEIKGNNSLEELHIYAPVRYHRPIGAVMYSYNDKFYLTISLHDSLNLDTSHKVINEIKERISTLPNLK